MKFLSKNKYLVAGTIFVLVLAGAGGYYFMNKQKEEKEAVEQEIKTQDTQYPEGEEDQREADPPVQNQDNSVDNQPLNEIPGVTLTVYVNTEDLTVGTKSIPAGSISLNFYTVPGTYVVQKQVGPNWDSFGTSVKYSGTGGLIGGYLSPELS